MQDKGNDFYFLLRVIDLLSLQKILLKKEIAICKEHAEIQ